MKNIYRTYDNVEQYVKLNHIAMKDEERAGRRAQYQELLDSAQTVDLLAQQYAEIGRSQDDLGRNNIFEMHMAKIAIHDYKVRTPRGRCSFPGEAKDCSPPRSQSEPRIIPTR